MPRPMRPPLLALAFLAGALAHSDARATVDGVWTLIPQARSNESEMLAADAVHQRVFRFGGVNEASTSTLSELVSLPTPHWVDLVPTGVRPPVRVDGTLIYDSAGDRLVLFGGADFPVSYNDVWTVNLSGTPQWTPLAPAGAPPSARASHVAIYDPPRQRMVMFGGDLWSLSLSGVPTWAPLAASGSTPPLPNGSSAVYDPVGDRMLLFGGSPNLGQGTNATFQLTLAGTPAWSQVPTSGALPSPRFDQAMALDGPRGRLLVYGGWVVLDPFDPQPFRSNDAWSLDLTVTPSPWSRIDGGIGSPDNITDREAYVDFDGSRLVLAGHPVLRTLDFASSQWGALVPANTGPVNPVEDLHSGAVTDATTGRTYLFAGGQLFSTTSSPVADWIAYPGGPGPRSGSALVLDATRRRLLLIGGRTSLRNFDGAPTAETWAFSLDSGTWDGTPFATLPFTIENAAAVADPANDRVFLFGGQIDPAVGFNLDLWQLSLGSAAWQKLRPMGAPGGRYRPAMVLDEARSRLLVYSGQDINNGAILGELWAVKLKGKNARWTQLASTQPGAAAYPSAAIDAGRHRLLVTGLNPNDGRSVIQAFDLVNGTWSTLAPPGNIPFGRTHPAVWFDSGRDRLLVYGGRVGLPGSSPGQIWGLSFGSPVPVTFDAVAGSGAGTDVGDATGPATIAMRVLSANPLTTGRLELSIEARTPALARAQLFDVAGRVVATAERHVAPGTAARVAFDTRSLAPGLYLVRVSHGTDQATIRVVIAR